MATYYVKPDGNDADTGVDWDHAWQTIAHAQANVVSGAGQLETPNNIADAKDWAVSSLGSLKWFYLDDDSGGGGTWHGFFNVIHIAAGTYNETPAFIFNPPAWTRWSGAGFDDTALFAIGYDDNFQITNDYIVITDCCIGGYYTPEFVVNSSDLAIISSGLNGNWGGTPSKLYWDDCVFMGGAVAGIIGAEFDYITDSIIRNASSGAGPTGWVSLHGDRNHFEDNILPAPFGNFGMVSGDDNLFTSGSYLGVTLSGNSRTTVQGTTIGSLQIVKSNCVCNVGGYTDLPLHLAFGGGFLWLTEDRAIPGKCCQYNQNTGEILKSWSAPANKPQGIAWDGSHLWIVCTLPDNVCYETDTDGNVLSQFNICGSALTWVDGYLYTYCSNSFYKYDTSGNIIEIYPIVVPATALAYDGTYIWGIQSGTESIINKFSVTGELLESIDTEIYRYVTAWFSGIAADTDAHIWIMQDDQGYYSPTFLVSDGMQECIDCDLTTVTTKDGTTLSLVRNDKKFYDTSVGNAWTTVTVAQTILEIPASTTSSSLTERPFLITTDANISALITSWSTTGDRNKQWKVEATGARTIAFQLGDMLPDTEYDLRVDGAKVSSAESDGSGVIAFPEYSGTFSEKVFETEVVSGSVPRVMIF
jgi:hypothetical protein